jgi:hypothetical protein
MVKHQALRKPDQQPARQNLHRDRQLTGRAPVPCHRAEEPAGDHVSLPMLLALQAAYRVVDRQCACTAAASSARPPVAAIVAGPQPRNSTARAIWPRINSISAKALYRSVTLDTDELCIVKYLDSESCARLLYSAVRAQMIQVVLSCNYFAIPSQRCIECISQSSWTATAVGR